MKAQRIDDDPVSIPKVKAAKTWSNVNQIAKVDICHNDEEMYPDDWNEDDEQLPHSEDEYIAEHKLKEKDLQQLVKRNARSLTIVQPKPRMNRRNFTRCR